MISEQQLQRLALRLIERAYLVSHDRHKPGEVIRRLPAEDKQQLRHLTARHFSFDLYTPPLKGRVGGRWNLGKKQSNR